jgi:hypothetical protein
MESSTGQGPHERPSAPLESALGELAKILLDNPWTHQALKVALEARERAQHAGKEAIKASGMPSAHDVERVERRLRGVSERLEEVEDRLDDILREVAELRRARPKVEGQAPPPGAAR